MTSVVAKKATHSNDRVQGNTKNAKVYLPNAWHAMPAQSALSL